MNTDNPASYFLMIPVILIPGALVFIFIKRCVFPAAHSFLKTHFNKAKTKLVQKRIEEAGKRAAQIEIIKQRELKKIMESEKEQAND